MGFVFFVYYYYYYYERGERTVGDGGLGGWIMARFALPQCRHVTR